MLEFIDRKDYHTDFFGCFEDCGVCCYSCVCAPCAVGSLVGDMEGESFNFVSCLAAPIGAFRARRKIQTLHKEKESEDASMCASCMCAQLSIMQDYREWKILKTAASQAQAQPVVHVMPTHPV